MYEHFNKLTPEAHEALSLLAEELAESIQIVGKILRHGLRSENPDDPGTCNLTLLEQELGHVEFAKQMVVDYCGLDMNGVASSMVAKANRVQQYLHHCDAKGNWK